MIHNAYVGLGSNVGNRAAYLLLGVRGMLDAGLDAVGDVANPFVRVVGRRLMRHHEHRDARRM